MERKTHHSCEKYSKSKENCLIEIRRLEKGTILQKMTGFNEFIAILDGVMNYSFGQNQMQEVREGSIFIIPAKQNYKIEIKESSAFIIFRLDIGYNFCNHYSFEILYKDSNRRSNESATIIANSVVNNYLDNLALLLNEGIECNYLLELKLKELLYLLGYYYSSSELEKFFSPILCDDFSFSSLIRKHYSPSLSIGELAKKVNYSISGFEKRFKKVFDIPPSKWMQSQRANAIYHEINCSTKSFADLSLEYGFSSPSHFNNFCKKKFNATPGNIRKKGVKANYL
jgi:AraC-like DNA-binding protein